jgi:hypothetical protein
LSVFPILRVFLMHSFIRVSLMCSFSRVFLTWSFIRKLIVFNAQSQCPSIFTT